MLSICVYKISICCEGSHSLTISCGAKDEPRRRTSSAQTNAYMGEGWLKSLPALPLMQADVSRRRTWEHKPCYCYCYCDSYCFCDCFCYCYCCRYCYCYARPSSELSLDQGTFFAGALLTSTAAWLQKQVFGNFPLDPPDPGETAKNIYKQIWKSIEIHINVWALHLVALQPHLRQYTRPWSIFILLDGWIWLFLIWTSSSGKGLGV